jgi:hypothetical protein
MDPNDAKIKTFLNEAVNIALEAGAVIRNTFNSGIAIDVKDGNLGLALLIQVIATHTGTY